MEDNNIHSKIINQVCREVLIPLGVFQKGASRLYLDDNDYFFTVIEFQPSTWSNGTYLNIGLTFFTNTLRAKRRSYEQHTFRKRISAVYHR